MLEEEIEIGEEIVVLDGNEVQDADDGEVIVETAESSRLRKEVNDLLSKVNETYWELAEALAKVMNGKHFKAWGFESFEKYLEEECGLRRGKGYALPKIYNYFAYKLKEGFTKYPEEYARLMDCIKEIGWAKARLLATNKIITPMNVDRIIEMAKTLSMDQLDIRCKEEFLALPQKDKEDSDDDNTVKLVRKGFNFTIYQMEMVDQAIAKALSTMLEGATPSSAVALICQDFCSNNVEINSERSREENVALLLSKLERVLNLSFIAYDSSSNSVLYGEDTLETMLNNVPEMTPEDEEKKEPFGAAEG